MYFEFDVYEPKSQFGLEAWSYFEVWIETHFFFQQNERDAQFKNTTITPESRLILQQWLSGDYQLYNYFNHQLGEKLKQLGTQVVDENLKALRDSNRKLKESCNAHFVDNESLKGTPLHMAHHMVKAYDLAENCIYFAMAEPAFYNQIKKQQKAGKPTPQNISKSKAKRWKEIVIICQ